MNSKAMNAMVGVGIIALTQLTIGCGDSSSSEKGLELTGAAAEIADIIASAENTPSFASNFAKATGSKLGSISATLTKNMSDGSFVFEGESYSKIKAALLAKKSDFATLGSVGKTFGSAKQMFAAHGLSGKIKPEELKAYVKVASLSMKSLSNADSNSVVSDRNISTRTLAAAMRVSLALKILGSKTAEKVALALAAEKDYGNPGGFGVCGAYSNNHENKSWLCFQDNISGSIGYYADSSKKMWQDCCSSERKFKVCDSAFMPKDGGSWGWIPDPRDPTGQKGESCHSPFTTSSKTLKSFCKTTTVKVDSWQCKDEESNASEVDVEASTSDGGTHIKKTSNGIEAESSSDGAYAKATATGPGAKADAHTSP